MARGLLTGLLSGAVVAGAGAVGLSLVYPDFRPDIAEDGAQVSAPVAPAQTDAVAAEPVQPAPSEPVSPAATEVTAPDTAAAPDPVIADDPVALPATEATPDPQDQAQPTAELPSTDAPEPVAQDDPDTQEPPAAVTDVFDPDAVEAPEQVLAPPADPETDTDTETDTESAAQDTAEAAPSDPAPATPEPETPEPATPESASEITDSIIAALPKPGGTVGDLAPEVTTSRLPTVADEDTATTPEPDDAPSAVAPPPIQRFAASYEAEEGKPLMSIVLLDDGASDLGVEALEAFPYPLTFAVDAAAPDAAERMQSYRSKGFEVMALAALPRGATASDAEIAMSAYLSAVPEAVAILEAPDISLQASREVSDQITEIVLESGHGLVLQANGLNTVQKLARREGVPSATVFRDFDSKNQTAAVIRRFLDQAAFKAGQEGGVIMMGRLRAETISALLIWGLADRASRVALVPVSAVLTQGEFPR